MSAYPYSDRTQNVSGPSITLYDTSTLQPYHDWQHLTQVHGPTIAGSTAAAGAELEQSASTQQGPVDDELFGITRLTELPEPNYRLLQPLYLVIHRTRECYWVAPQDFVLHGFGKTVREAVEDYGYGLLDYYDQLHRDRDILAPHLLDHLAYLDKIIVKE